MFVKLKWHFYMSLLMNLDLFHYNKDYCMKLSSVVPKSQCFNTYLCFTWRVCILLMLLPGDSLGLDFWKA